MDNFRYLAKTALISFFMICVNTFAGTVYDIGGSFSVGQDGDLNYEIPILAPKGINGLKQEFSFSYGSGVENGKMGQGWSFDVADSITRCIKTHNSDFSKIPDDKLKPLSFNWDDGYCLNGDLLIATTGEYGKDGTVYRALNDPQTKIASYGTSGSGPKF